MIVIETKGRTYNLTDKDLDRFWSKVDMTDDCWLWLPYKDKDGYGEFSISTFSVKAHRISYMINKGNVPDNMKVLHECDNPSCVNPKHLFLGTSLDNNRDCIRKGRKLYQLDPEKHSKIARNNSLKKLTEKQVLDIREMYRDGFKIMEIHRVTDIPYTTVCSIVHRKTWKHI